MNFRRWKDCKAVAADLRRIYSAPPPTGSRLIPMPLRKNRQGKYRFIAQVWREARAEVIPFLGFDPAI
nr:hypothetical protein [Paracoccus aerius]